MQDSLMISEYIAAENASYQCETPLNEVLSKMISRIKIGKIYNPAA